MVVIESGPSPCLPMVCPMAESPLTDGVVTLRPWAKADAAELVKCIDGDPEITRWLDQVPQPYRTKDALAYIRGVGESAFAVLDAETGRVLGSIGVRFSDSGDVGEIGYWLRADARGRGAITRALRVVSAWAFGRGRSRAAAAARGRRERSVAPRRREGGVPARRRAAERVLERAARPPAGLGAVLAPAERGLARRSRRPEPATPAPSRGARRSRRTRARAPRRCRSST